MNEPEQEYETADAFVDGTELVPPATKGQVPLYEDHPPDTHLPMWRCPHCGESGVTMRALWDLRQRVERLVDEKNEHDYDDPEWHDYNGRIQATNREINRLLSALPANVTSWANRNIRPRQWEDSELNPENYRAVPREGGSE